jgi:uncharacterized protein YcnI
MRGVADDTGANPDPAQVPSATPSVHPLWDVSTKEGKKNRVELHGETITRGVSEVTYTAREPLPPDRLDSFAISLKLPAGEEGESVYFPTIQRCEEGQTRWIQIPAEGESAEELEERRRAAKAGRRAPRNPPRTSRPRP